MEEMYSNDEVDESEYTDRTEIEEEQHAIISPLSLQLLRNDNNSIEHDINLICHKQVFRTHKLMLALNSLYFYRLFTKSTEPVTSLSIHDVKPEILSVMLNFFYSGKWRNELVDSRMKSQIDEVREMFECFEVNGDTWNNIFIPLATIYYFDIWNLAILYRRKDIEKELVIFLAKNPSLCLNDSNFLKLSLHQIIALLSNEEMASCNETIQMDLIRRWVLHNTKARDKFVTSLLSVAKLSPMARSSMLEELEKCATTPIGPSPRFLSDRSSSDGVIYKNTPYKWSTLLKQVCATPLEQTVSPKPLLLNINSSKPSICLTISETSLPSSVNLPSTERKNQESSNSLLYGRSVDTIECSGLHKNFDAYQMDRPGVRKNSVWRKPSYEADSEPFKYASSTYSESSSSIRCTPHSTGRIEKEKKGSMLYLYINEPNAKKTVQEGHRSNETERKITRAENKKLPSYAEQGITRQTSQTMTIDLQSLSDCDIFSVSNSVSDKSSQLNGPLDEHKTFTKDRSNFYVVNSEETLKKKLMLYSPETYKCENSFEMPKNVPTKKNCWSRTQKEISLPLSKVSVTKHKHSKCNLNTSPNLTIDLSDIDSLSSETTGRFHNLNEKLQRVIATTKTKLCIKSPLSIPKHNFPKSNSYTVNPLDIHHSLQETYNSMPTFRLSSPVVAVLPTLDKKNSLLESAKTETKEMSRKEIPLDNQSCKKWASKDDQCVQEYLGKSKAKNESHKISERMIQETPKTKSQENFETTMKESVTHHLHKMSERTIKTNATDNHDTFTSSYNQIASKTILEDAYQIENEMQMSQSSLYECKQSFAITTSKESLKTSINVSECFSKSTIETVEKISHAEVLTKLRKSLPLELQTKLKDHPLVQMDPCMVLVVEDRKGNAKRCIYNMHSKKWVYALPLTVPQYGSSYAMLHANDKLYFIGSQDETDLFAWNSAYEFDCQNQKFRQLPDILVTRYRMALSCISNSIYVIGGLGAFGNVLSIVERLDEETSKWIFVAPLRKARFDASAVVLQSCIYVAGGLCRLEDSDRTILECEKYDPAANQWTIIANLPPYFGFYNPVVVKTGENILAMRQEKPDHIYEFNSYGNTWKLLHEEEQTNHRVSKLLPGENKVYAVDGIKNTIFSFGLSLLKWKAEITIPPKMRWKNRAYVINLQEGSK